MSTEAISPLRQRMIEDMNSRKLGAHTQRSHIYSCKRFAAFLERSPDTATLEDIRLFQLHLAETGMSICNRNRIMTGVRFLLRVTLRRLDLSAEIYHLREPQKIPQVMSPDETRRLLAVATSLKARVLLSLSYGCGLRAGEVVRLKVKHIDSAQRIIRIEQSKGRKDRHLYEVSIAGKLVELLKEMVPHLARVAMLFNPNNSSAKLYWPLIQKIAKSTGIVAVSFPVRDAASTNTPLVRSFVNRMAG